MWEHVEHGGSRDSDQDEVGWTLDWREGDSAVAAEEEEVLSTSIGRAWEAAQAERKKGVLSCRRTEGV